MPESPGNHRRYRGVGRGTPDPVRRKLVVVGDGACGKTSLLTVYTTGEFPEVHIPTLFETRMTDIQVGNQKVEMSLWDTAGQEHYDRLRPLSYPNTDVILMCFSIDSPNSFKNVKQRWIPEVKHFCPLVPIILVACKKDLRDTDSAVANDAMKEGKPISYKEGKVLADKIRAQAFYECSAKMQEGVNDVFTMAGRLSLPQKKGKGKGKMCLLV